MIFLVAGFLTLIPVHGIFTLYHEEGKVLQNVSCHPDMLEPLTQALRCVKPKLPKDYKLVYHGCYNYRNRRSPEGVQKPKLSHHASGKAIDINAHRELPKGLVECFESSGFEWGGRWSNPDPMHFQLKGL